MNVYIYMHFGPQSIVSCWMYPSRSEVFAVADASSNARCERGNGDSSWYLSHVLRRFMLL